MIATEQTRSILDSFSSEGADDRSENARLEPTLDQPLSEIAPVQSSDASSIATEQTRSILDSFSSEGADGRSENARLEPTLDQPLSEIAPVQSKPADFKEKSKRHGSEFESIRIPAGVSEAADAAVLLRDDSGMAKFYGQLQELSSALCDEKLGRKQVEELLKHILHDVWEKSGVILDKQAELERMLEAYSDLNLKFQYSCSEQAKLKNTIKDLKDELSREKHVNITVEEEVFDLRRQNDHLRSLVHSLENRILELKQMNDLEIQKQLDEAASKVAAVLERSSEQLCKIELLHNSVAMYRHLYEAEQKLRSSVIHAAELAPDDERWSIILLLKEAKQKIEDKAAERIRCVEQDLSKSRREILSLQLEREELAMEVRFTREKLESLTKEFEHQRDEMNGVLARNVEKSQLIIDYKRKLHENSLSLQASEEDSQKLTLEVSILKAEKELLSNSEKRACDEVRGLMEGVHCLQRLGAEVQKDLQDERASIRKLTLDREDTLKDAMRQVDELRKEFSNALHAVAAAEDRAVAAEGEDRALATGNISAPAAAADVPEVSDEKGAKHEI